jgi:hypothetical protein
MKNGIEFGPNVDKESQCLSAGARRRDRKVCSLASGSRPQRLRELSHSLIYTTVPVWLRWALP